MSDAVRRRALSVLLESYLPALNSYLRVKHRLRESEADDVLQAFVADKILERDLFSGANRQRGRFRCYLLCALDRFVVDQVRHKNAAKRSPGHIRSLDADSGLDKAAPDAPDAFDAAWARQVLELTIARMQGECGKSGRNDVWQVFDERVVRPSLTGEPPGGLEHLVNKTCLSPQSVSNLLVTGKRIFARTLRAVVLEYAEEAEVDDEIRWLRSRLARRG